VRPGAGVRLGALAAEDFGAQPRPRAYDENTAPPADEPTRPPARPKPESRTGQGVAAWNERIAAGTPANRADEPALRKWLSAEGVTGYAQALLVWETFGYPEFLVADAEEVPAM
jgi:hypothetical protein